MKQGSITHRLSIITVVIIMATACSTTQNLPEGETLYTGIKNIIIENEDKSETGQVTMDEVKAAISVKPNNSLFGSASKRFPIPFGLWIYNKYEKYEKGFKHWIFKTFAADPVLLSKVNPETRVKVATNLLHDYGYFNGNVTYQLDSMKNPREMKVTYKIDMKQGYLVDTIVYEGFDHMCDSLIMKHRDQRIVRPGDHFDVTKLIDEKERLSKLFRNHGYYYYRPDFITFLADTIMHPGHVYLKVQPKSNIPEEAKRIYYMGNTSVYMTGHDGKAPTDSVKNGEFTIHYSGKKMELKYPVLRNRFLYKPGNKYSQQIQDYTQEALSRLGVFKYNEFQYNVRTGTLDTLDVRVNAQFDLPYDSELEFNFVSKNTRQMGPGAGFKIRKNNFASMGASLNFDIYGSYEWQASSTVDGEKTIMNSYEMGTSLSLDFPRLILPGTKKKADKFRFPSKTRFKLYADFVNRAEYFRLLSFGGNVSYEYQPRPGIKHTVVPLDLSFNTLRNTTTKFDSIATVNPMLFISLDNQFIPAQSYTITYDNNYRKQKSRIWWENSIKSAGNITSAIYAIFGDGFDKRDKKLLGNPFAQFLKFSTDFRYAYRFSEKHELATRLMAGVIWSYGNKLIAPYNEQFYVGGANSIRAFTIRSIGPGHFHPASNSQYSYVDETGDIKLEANIEYRFRILSDFLGGNFNGAAFLDAGNVWLMRKDEARPGGDINAGKFFDSIALGTGIGIRYDLSFLVLRLDWGIALHVPYDTGKRGYYNIPRFKDGMGLHLAIGYPF